MPKGNNKRYFTARDYVTLGLSLVLAFAIWLIYNLSLKYSDFVQCKIVLSCPIPTYNDVSSTSAQVVARCEMDGYQLIGNKYSQLRNRSPKVINVAPEDVHPYSEDKFYVTAEDITKYCHEIFGIDAKLEYLVSDTLIFRFARQLYKKVPVNLVYDLSYQSQYMPLSDLVPDPDSIYVYGEEQTLASIVRVNSKLISLSDVSDDVFGEIALEPVKKLRYSVRKVTYSQAVSRYVEQTLTVPVKTRNVPQGVELLVFPQTATLVLNMRYPSEVKLDDLCVEVDFNDYSSGCSGKCMGYPSKLGDGIINCRVEPEVFDCLLQQI